MNDFISIKGARTNNLKNISLNIPKRKITVITGVSGSGKSSLIFDTLAAESQRLLNETYSSYIQLQLPHYAPPVVDSIQNLPVSIVIGQKKIGGNARSTVGTITDIYTSLRLLFSRIAKPFIGYSMMYSFNNPAGMCPTCKGLGEIKTINLKQLIDFNKSLNEGAINFPTFFKGGWRLSRYTESGYFDNDKKIKDFTKSELSLLLYETDCPPKFPTKNWPKTASYIGIIPRITRQFIEKEPTKYATELSRILHTNECVECRGTRVNKLVRSAKINGKSIADCVTMPIVDLLLFVKAIDAPDMEVVFSDLIKKLTNLEKVGLGYLYLNRPTATLSGGESQRIKITKHLTSALSDVLYIFDEPSVGLHPEDISNLSAIIYGLKKKGNTVLLVDHDPDIIKMADHVIELGVGAGINGGTITFEGSYQALLNSDTPTAQTLSQSHLINPVRKSFSDFYVLIHASAHTIHDVSVNLPKHSLTAVTGVAGAGKSTLIRHLLKGAYPEALVLDQSPIRGSNRSNILTYLNLFDKIRHIFAQSSGKSRSLFSFNGKGACPICKGKGYLTLDLAFMGDVKQTCEKCHGKRYNEEALSVIWNNRTIYDMLQLTTREALDVFYDEPFKQTFKYLIDVNLDYVKLGQPLNTFSGGERQRLKIASTLLKETNDLLLLDEPTTGLHETDIRTLLNFFEKLVKKGKTVIVLEHNLQVISRADWLIDMGLGAGYLGGNILFEGYPIDLLTVENSYTAKHLRNYIR